MNELIVVFYILATLALAYLWIYPTFIGNNLKLMAWVDTVVTSVPIAISAILFWQSDPVFNLFGFELNWFLFTLITLLIIELPIFLLYLRARGLSKEYWSYLKGTFTGGEYGYTAAAKSVEKQLNDTKWDGLRTSGAKLFLLVASNLVIVAGTVFLFTVGDNPLSSYIIIHILLIGVFWFLLRKSVRLVADAPDEALDEMMIRQRDRSYLWAYRVMTSLLIVPVIALLIFSFVSDASTGSDGFNYSLAFTYPQVQAVVWLIIGYSWMLPSMTLLGLDLKRERGKKN
jgi:hypothetical protein